VVTSAVLAGSAVSPVSAGPCRTLSAKSMIREPVSMRPATATAGPDGGPRELVPEVSSATTACAAQTLVPTSAQSGQLLALAAAANEVSGASRGSALPSRLIRSWASMGQPMSISSQ